MNKISDVFKSYFFTGLLVIVPLVVSLWLFKSIINWVDEVFGVEGWSPFFVPGLGLVLALALILLAGAIGKNFIGKWLVGQLDEVIKRVPVIGGVYSALRQTMVTLFSGGGKKFGQAVLIEWPRKGMWSVAFLTANEAPQAFQGQLGPDMVSVFVPATPNPTAGFLMYVSRSEIRPLDMKADEALRLIVSLGLAEKSERKG